MKKELKGQAARRLKIIEGQIRGLQKMVDEEKYCVDIITQTEAVREALNGVKDLVLRNHLLTHLADQMKGGGKDRAVEEMMAVYSLIGKK